VRAIPPRLLRWGESLANTLALFVERLEAEAALLIGERKARALADELQAANAELEAFAYSVSHDLRSPLRTMQGFAHAVLRRHGEAIPPEARDFVDRIIASGRQSEDLIRDLLAYSRLSSEDLELRPLDVERAVGDARAQVAADLKDRDADLSVPETYPVVIGHHTTLVQILANLLSNAVRFVPDDRTPVVVLRWEDSSEGERVRFWVEDNGVGILPQHQERIFKVFERLGGEIQRPGTGIGLAIVRRGAHRMRGEVGVVSDGEGGSRFWLELPTGQPQGWAPWGRRRDD
jgi:signal transduction histidine kinase